MHLKELIVEKLRKVCPDPSKRYALHEPEFAGREWEYLKNCLDTGYVSSIGAYVDKFEKDLAEVTEVKRAVAVANGTAALHIALKLLGVGAGDEVLVPTLTFIATANSIAYCGALPHFVDSEERSLGVDAAKLSEHLSAIAVRKNGAATNRHTGKRLAALVVMHAFGHPVDLDPICEVCREYGIPLIEDAAESLGSYYKGKHTGNWGQLSTLSFNGNKVVTTGGGGAIFGNDEQLLSRAKHITTTAKVPHPFRFIHDEIGYNYRMPNVNAALGCAQLERLPDFIERKRKLAATYEELFHELPGVRFFKEPQYARGNYWLNAILLDKPDLALRDAILEFSIQNGIQVRPLWDLMHTLEMYKEAPRMDLSCAEEIEKRLINLPSSAGLGK